MLLQILFYIFCVIPFGLIGIMIGGMLVLLLVDFFFGKRT